MGMYDVAKIGERFMVDDPANLLIDENTSLPLGTECVVLKLQYLPRLPSRPFSAEIMVLKGRYAAKRLTMQLVN